LTVPSLFIWGKNDQLIEVDKSMTLVKSANQGNNLYFKIFENANHSLNTGGKKPVHLKYMKEWLTKIAN